MVFTNDGITLVELLITITILGILFSICAPNMMKAVERSKDMTKEINSKLLQSIIQTYNNEQLAEGNKLTNVTVISKIDIKNEDLLLRIPHDLDWDMLYPIHIDSNGIATIKYDG
ncbi:MAG: type II secretion system protein [Clostridiales bacterium]|nr:type II secretion system protein [Clostridiales bacterium]